MALVTSSKKNHGTMITKNGEKVFVTSAIKRFKYNKDGYAFAGDKRIKHDEVFDEDQPLLPVVNEFAISAVDQGDNDFNREGLKIYVCSVRLRATFFPGSTGSITPMDVTYATCRIMLIRDNLGDGTTPSITDIFLANRFILGLNSQMSKAVKNRYTVLIDKIVQLHVDMPPVSIDEYRKVNFKTYYTSSTATSFTRGSMFLYMGTQAITTSARPHVSYSLDWHFYD